MMPSVTVVRSADRADRPEVVALAASDTGVGFAGVPESVVPADLRTPITQFAARIKPGEVLELPLPGRSSGPAHVLVVDIGDGASDDVRRAGAQVARATSTRPDAVYVAIPSAPVQPLVEGLVLGAYRFRVTARRSAGPRIRRPHR